MWLTTPFTAELRSEATTEQNAVAEHGRVFVNRQSSIISIIAASRRQKVLNMQECPGLQTADVPSSRGGGLFVMPAARPH